MKTSGQDTAAPHAAELEKGTSSSFVNSSVGAVGGLATILKSSAGVGRPATIFLGRGFETITTGFGFDAGFDATTGTGVPLILPLLLAVFEVVVGGSGRSFETVGLGVVSFGSEPITPFLKALVFFGVSLTATFLPVLTTAFALTLLLLGVVELALTVALLASALEVASIAFLTTGLLDTVVPLDLLESFEVAVALVELVFGFGLSVEVAPVPVLSSWPNRDELVNKRLINATIMIRMRTPSGDFY